MFDKLVFGGFVSKVNTFANGVKNSPIIFIEIVQNLQYCILANVNV